MALGGFLAAYGFDNHKYTIDKQGIQKYYKGRFVKVLIPTWIFISLAYIFNMQESHVAFTTILKWLTCTFNGGGAGIKYVGASWYVFIVMWCYLATPLLLKCLNGLEKQFRGRELIGYLRLIAIICAFGVLYRLLGNFLDMTSHANGHIIYNWCYANVLACIDVYFIGIIGERLMKYIPKISDDKNRKFRIIAIASMLFSTFVFLGMYRYLRTLYRIIGPCMFTLSTVAIIISTSMKKEYIHNNNKIARLCNVIAPYTFMFYLWHSALLFFVANKLVIGNMYTHYFAMLFIGGMVTIYMAYLMTNMNKSITKTFLNTSLSTRKQQ